jgi:CHRD domain
MHHPIAAVPARRLWLIAAAVAAAIAFALLWGGPGGPARAFAACENPRTLQDDVNCFVPIEGTYSFSVPLDAATQDATPFKGDEGMSGSSSITINLNTNQVCASTMWSGNHSPVVAGHIHGGSYGQPENPAVTIPIINTDLVHGVSSPQQFCTIAPPVEIGEIAKCPQQFNVTIHTQQKPAGAIRGQLGTTCVL